MKQLVGGILIAIGILIAGASGLCSLYMFFSSDAFASGGELLSILPVILIFGGGPIAAGVAIAWGGWTLLRRARNDPDRGGYR